LKKGILKKEKYDKDSNIKNRLRAATRTEERKREEEEERKISYIKDRLLSILTGEEDSEDDEKAKVNPQRILTRGKIKQFKESITEHMVEDLKKTIPSKLLEDDIPSIPSKATGNLKPGVNYVSHVDYREGGDDNDPKWNFVFTNHKYENRDDYMIPGENHPWGEINDDPVMKDEQRVEPEIFPTRSRRDGRKNLKDEALSKTIPSKLLKKGISKQSKQDEEDSIKNRLRNALKT